MWINAIKNKPKTDTLDKWNGEERISEKVVVWLEGEDYPNFGRYYHKTKHWTIEGHLGFDQKKVKYFMYIDNPYLLTF